jgi:hypothetical protein
MSERVALEASYHGILLELCGVKPNEQINARETPTSRWERSRVRNVDNIPTEELQKLISNQVARVKLAGADDGTSKPRTVDIPMQVHLLRPADSGQGPGEAPDPRGSKVARIEVLEEQMLTMMGVVAQSNNIISNLSGRVATLEHLVAQLKQGKEQLEQDVTRLKGSGLLLEQELGRLRASGLQAPGLPQGISPTQTSAPGLTEMYSGKRLLRADVLNSWGGDSFGAKDALLKYATLEDGIPYRATRFNVARGRAKSSLIRKEDTRAFIEMARREFPQLYPANPGEIYIAYAEALANATVEALATIKRPSETQSGSRFEPADTGSSESVVKPSAASKSSRNRKRPRPEDEEEIPVVTPSTALPKGCNEPFIKLFKRAVAFLSPNPPDPIPGPLTPPETADGIPWLWYAVGGTFQDGVGHSTIDEDNKPSPGSAPRCSIDKVQAELWYRNILDRQWQSPAAAYNLGLLVEDKRPNEALKLFSLALDACDKYSGHPCVMDLEDNDRTKRQLIAKVARLRKRLGMEEEPTLATLSGDSNRTLVDQSNYNDADTIDDVSVGEEDIESMDT